MTVIRISAGSKDSKNRLYFEVENADGETHTFSIPKPGYYTRDQIRALDAWGSKNKKATDAQAFAALVEQTDEKAAEFIRADNIEAQQIDALWAAYKGAGEAVTEGESEASSSS